MKFLFVSWGSLSRRIAPRHGRICGIFGSCIIILRVLHYNKEKEIQEGEQICHKDIADDLLPIFRELYKAHYPIERMVLIDEYDADDDASMRANNTSAFNFRAASGMRRLSIYLGKTIYEEWKPKKTVWAEKFFQIITSLRMGFKMDAITGESGLDIGLGDI